METRHALVWDLLFAVRPTLGLEDGDLELRLRRLEVHARHLNQRVHRVLADACLGHSRDLQDRTQPERQCYTTLRVGLAPASVRHIARSLACCCLWTAAPSTARRGCRAHHCGRNSYDCDSDSGDTRNGLPYSRASHRRRHHTATSHRGGCYAGYSHRHPPVRGSLRRFAMPNKSSNRPRKPKRSYRPHESSRSVPTPPSSVTPNGFCHCVRFVPCAQRPASDDGHDRHDPSVPMTYRCMTSMRGPVTTPMRHS